MTELSPPTMLRVLFLLVALLCLSAPSIQAQSAPESINWQKMRDTQPAGLTLKLEIPKTRFHQGEVIDATLTFTNTSAEEYYLWIGTYDRSGRIQDIQFYATDADEKLARDPLQWHFRQGYMGGGLGNHANLGEWKITLPANQWVSFERPGTYQLFAHSSRPAKGSKDSSPRQPEHVAVVSDRVTITVDPITPEIEASIIDEAKKQLANDKAEEAASRLRYLGTPAALETLLPYLNNLYDARMAFLSSPDSEAAAAMILLGVRESRLKFDPSIANLYSSLKCRKLAASFTLPPPPETEMAKLREAYQKEREQTTEEITKAAVAASGGKGPAYYDTVIGTLFSDVKKRPEARAELVKVQLDLTPEQAATILRSWGDFGGEDFLPLARKMVQEPHDSGEALKALSRIKPEEARLLIIEDIQRKSPRFLGKGAPQIANRALLSLPADPIVELEPFFLQQIQSQSPPNLDLLLSAIERYGSASLLEPVIRFYRPKAGRWACDIQATILRFWLHHDPDNGLAALKDALTYRDKTRCYTSVLSDVLLTQWDPKALPLLTEALDDAEPEVVFSAIQVLEAKADREFAPACLAALQRLMDANKAGTPQPRFLRETAQNLLQSSRWKFDSDQRANLESIASGATK